MRPRGFTLVDILLASVILAIAVTAVIKLMSMATLSNGQTAKLTQAINLANNIHELAMRMPVRSTYNGTTYPYTRPSGQAPSVNSNVMWLDGYTFDPPVDSLGNAISNSSGQEYLPGWSQVCAVNVFDIANPAGAEPAQSQWDSCPRLLKVTINFNGKPIYKTSWIISPTISPI